MYHLFGYPKNLTFLLIWAYPDHFGFLRKLSNASIRTPVTVASFSLAYLSILSTIWQGRSMFKVRVGSAIHFQGCLFSLGPFIKVVFPHFPMLPVFMQ